MLNLPGGDAQSHAEYSFSSLLLRTIVIFMLHPPVISDYKIMFEAANDLAAGDLSFLQTEYFLLWAYQIPFVGWEAMLLSLCNSIVFIKIINAVISSLTVLITYKIMCEIVRASTAQIGAIALMLYPFHFTLPTVLTNQIVSAFFVMLGVWVMVSSEIRTAKTIRIIMAMALIQIGYLLRPDAAVVSIAFVLLFTYKMIAGRDIAVIERVWGVVCVIATFFLTKYLCALLFRNLFGIGNIDNNFPAWKLILGLNHETGGQWSASDWKIVSATFSSMGLPTQETKELSRQIISQRIQVPLIQTMKLVLTKIDNLWLHNGMNWVFQHLKNADWSVQLVLNGVITFDRVIFFITIIFSILGVIFSKCSCKPKDVNILLFSLLVVVMFASAYTIIEVQPRYAYLPQFFIFIISTLGIDYIIIKANWKSCTDIKETGN